jgi:hypothetical protein
MASLARKGAIVADRARWAESQGPMDLTRDEFVRTALFLSFFNNQA